MMYSDYIRPALVLLSGSSIFVFLSLLARFRPVAFLSFSFILFTFAWRTLSSMYVDLAGPLLSSQLEDYIGPGIMTAFQAISYFLTIIPFLWFFQPSTLRQWALATEESTTVQEGLTLSDVTVVLSALLLLALYVNLIVSGKIPILAGMERWTFTRQYGGALHHFIIERGDMISFWWGTMFAANLCRRQRIDYRYLGLLIVLLFYMFLVGGRFSPFYRFGSFFIIPFAAVIVLQGDDPWFSLKNIFSDKRIFAASVGILALTAVLIATALYLNLTKVRGFEGKEAETAFIERSAVQPTELGWKSYQRVLINGEWKPHRTFDFLFKRPIAGGRNTTPQYLMSETIGEPRTTEHILGGFQFAGGFPEIFFELFGPYLAWPFILAAGWICACLLAIIVRSVASGRYLTSALSFYVLYGFYVMYIGGMLNFLAVKTYWVKVFVLFGALIIERTKPVVPWVLVDSRLMEQLSRRLPFRFF